MRREEFATLLDRLTPRLAPAPVVTAEQYRAIACNRCGACCEDIPYAHGPDEIAAVLQSGTLDADRQQFLSGLIPIESLERGWRYRCRHFRRDDDGLGVCTIHDRRPDICRKFPYGGVVRRWTQCAWYVQVRSPDGTRINVVKVFDVTEEGAASDAPPEAAAN